MSPQPAVTRVSLQPPGPLGLGTGDRACHAQDPVAHGLALLTAWRFSASLGVLAHAQRACRTVLASRRAPSVTVLGTQAVGAVAVRDSEA